MKIYLIVIILFLSTSVFAQPDSTSNSLIEKFSNKPGNLYKREFIDLKTFSGVKVQVLKITTDTMKMNLMITTDPTNMKTGIRKRESFLLLTPTP